MLKKMFLTLIAAALVFGTNEASFAMMCGSDSGHSAHAQAAPQSYSEKSVNIENKICPISGERINEASKAIYEYEGKIYNFCCPMCIDEFKKDPTKYSKKAG